MPLTASLDGNGPSYPLPSLSPGDGDSNDPPHSASSFSFTIYHLTLLISTLGLSASDNLSRAQLLAAIAELSFHLQQPPLPLQQQHRCPGGSSPLRPFTLSRATTPLNPHPTLARERPFTAVAEPHHPRADTRAAVHPSTSSLQA